MQTPNADTPLSPAAEATPRPGRVMTGIQEAADSTGVSFGYLLAQATQESGLDPHASNARSSASGLFQFTATTWLDMVRRHGAKHGLEDAAAAIVKTADGHLEIKDKAMKKAILDLRKDPKVSSLMAAEFAKDNARSLEHRLGRQATASDLYLAHFLGAAGAARVIEEMEDNPRHSARRLLPDAAKANPEVFGHARTVAGLYNNVQARLKEALGSHSAAAHQPAVDMADPKLAALRPLARPDATTAPSPTEAAIAQVVQASAPAPSVASASPLPPTRTVTVTAAAFAKALQPDSPYFPAAIPPAPDRAAARAQELADSPYFPAAIPPAPTGPVPETVSIDDGTAQRVKAGKDV